MDIQTKEKINKMIADLRAAEYLSGFASGVQLHECQLEQAEKANTIAYEILKNNLFVKLYTN